MCKFCQACGAIVDTASIQPPLADVAQQRANRRAGWNPERNDVTAFQREHRTGHRGQASPSLGIARRAKCGRSGQPACDPPAAVAMLHPIRSTGGVAMQAHQPVAVVIG